MDADHDAIDTIDNSINLTTPGEPGIKRKTARVADGDQYQVIPGFTSSLTTLHVDGPGTGSASFIPGTATLGNGYVSGFKDNAAQNFAVNLNPKVGSTLLGNLPLTSLPSSLVQSSQNGSVDGAATSVELDSQPNPILTVDAANPANVTFTVSGLISGDRGTLTFTDANGVKDIVNVGANGTYSTDLSNLANGTINYALAVIDSAGHVTTVDPTTTLGPGSASTVAGFPLNAEGWPIITPPSGARIIYVSSSTGNDGNNGLSSATPVASLAAGLALIRNNTGDELLLKAGDTWLNQSFGYLNVNGASASEPIVIGTYGTGPAPIVETPDSGNAIGIGSLGGSGRGGDFLVIEGIDFYAYQRDPNNPAYAGPNTDELGARFLNPVTDLTIVGCQFSFYTTDIVVDASSTGPSSTVMLYRDVVTNSWSADQHSQGVYLAGIANPVIEQSVFDHNGWNASIPGAGATIFNHNLYLQYTNGQVIFSGNISADSATDGVMVRSGGSITNNLFVNDAMGPIIGITPGSEPTAPVLTSAVISDNVILQATDIPSSPTQPRSMGIVVSNASGSGVQINDNIIANPNPNASTVNQDGLNIDNYSSGINATNNIIYGFTHPVVDTGSRDVTSPNAVNLTGYVNPNVSVESYNASLGGSSTLAAFMTAADSQSMSNWNNAYTAAAVDSYIQAGFATMATQVIASPSGGSEVPGITISITIDFGQPVTVTGTPTLALNDNDIATYTGGSGTSALTFSYTIAASDIPVSALAITGVNLANGATIEDEGGTPSNLSNALVTFSGLQIDTPPGPRLVAIADSPSSGALGIGSTVTLTLELSEAAIVLGGAPTLSLNNGGTASYVSGSGTNALTFSYTVLPGQNTSSLTVMGINQNSATITDVSGHSALLSFSGQIQNGPQIDAQNPVPPAGTSADLIMCNGNTGDCEIYDLGSNTVLAAYALGQAGTGWQVSGLGTFNGTDTSDMLLRNANTGQLEVYDISNNNITGAALLGQVGQPWQVAGLGDFSGHAGESDMLMRNASTGQFEVYDISNNAISFAAGMGQVGLEWQIAGFGDFSGHAGESDMLMRNASTGQFEVYDIRNNTISFAAGMGQVGLEWQIAGFGDFSGNANETDMLLRNSNTGSFEIYDIGNNTITAAASMGQVGLEWQVAGFGPIGGVGASDMLMRDTNNGAFELYDISNNRITTATSIGQVGMAWGVAGIAADPPIVTAASNNQLVQAMASFAPSSDAASTITPLNQPMTQTNTSDLLVGSAPVQVI